MKWKIDKNRIKDGGRKLLVDAASVAIFLMVVSTFLGGIGVLYADYYRNGKLPSPDVFTAAAQAFASSTSFVYLLILTRKYRAEPEEVKKKDETRQTSEEIH
jgi:purine-cytosine permease-like protein